MQSYRAVRREITAAVAAWTVVSIDRATAITQVCDCTVSQACASRPHSRPASRRLTDTGELAAVGSASQVAQVWRHPVGVGRTAFVHVPALEQAVAERVGCRSIGARLPALQRSQDPARTQTFASFLLHRCASAALADDDLVAPQATQPPLPRPHWHAEASVALRVEGHIRAAAVRIAKQAEASIAQRRRAGLVQRVHGQTVAEFRKVEQRRVAAYQAASVLIRTTSVSRSV